MATAIFSDDPLLGTVEAASVLGLSPGTLEVWRCTQRYSLPYVKCGRLVKYRRSDLLAWLAARTILHTGTPIA